MMNEIRNIIIYGEGGDGVRFLAKRLIFTINAINPNTYISYSFDYDATIKHGEAVAYISMNDKAVPSKIAFRNCDLLISFQEKYPSNINATQKLLMVKYKDANLSFREISTRAFKKQIYANMIAYGYVLKILGIPYSLDSLDETNQAAVLLGDKIAGGLNYEQS